jgi:hypothetical protein
MRTAWKRIRLWSIFALALIGTLVAMALPLVGTETLAGLELDGVATRDILAPSALTYTSEVLTERERQAAADAVLDQYQPINTQISADQLALLRSAFAFIDDIRADEFATLDQKAADMASLSEVSLDSTIAQAILELDEASWNSVKLESEVVLRRVMRKEIREAHLEEERRAVPAELSGSLPPEQEDLVVVLVRAFVTYNTEYDAAATEAAREAARAAVAPVSKSYAEGETIVTLGQVVTEVDIEALETYGLLKVPQIWQQIALRGLLVVLLAASISLYAYRVHAEQIQKPRMAATLAALFVVNAFVMQAAIPERTVLPYLFPAATIPILVAIAFSPGLGVMSALATGVIAGYLAQRGLEMTFYATLSGVLGALFIGRAERLVSFLWAGLASGVGAVAVVMLFRLTDPATDAIGKVTLAGSGLASGLLSAVLGLGLLLPIGGLLGIVTNLQLTELSRPDHPLLQLILRNAPGTYQHSLQVANLAENAARAIGANALLTRVGALYHDAGKAMHPQFFIENQVPGQNVHEQLDPTTSAGMIRSHVQEGIKLARKHRLPKAIEAFIAEHHGTMEASFLYQEAVEVAGGDESKVDHREFAYPGPKPLSRETALLMFADGVEAKARADTPKDDEEIDRIVRWVIKDRLDAGQLSRTDLTFKDLDTIRRSFVATLKSMYHPRLRYPGAEAEPESQAESLPTPSQTEQP